MPHPKQLPMVYSEPASITRTVSDWEDNVLQSETFQYDNLWDALKAIREMYEADRIMFMATKYRPGGLAADRHRECDDDYCYTFQLCNHEGQRKIVCGINDIKEHGHRVFCLNAGDKVTQQ